MVLALAMSVTMTVLLAAPVLFLGLRRRVLTRGELSVLVYPHLAWVLLLVFASSPRKALTNAEFELLLIAVAIAGLVGARTGLARIHASPRRVLFLPIATCLVVAVVFTATPPFRHDDLLGAWVYVSRYRRASEASRDAILRGVVLEGMAEGEAWAGGGLGRWMTRDGVLQFVTFTNRSQFGSDQPASFRAYFTESRVDEIERLSDVRECAEAVASAAADHPFAGFWKRDCADDFRLRFEPGAAGKYGTRFCGPGGCGEIDSCVAIPGKHFRVLDQDTSASPQATGGNGMQVQKACYGRAK